MKALKEKRIRLRSLWRRGLVILSLFALVFVSCSDSSGDDVATEPSTTPEPTLPRDASSFKITLPKVTQYEGTEFNLKGLKVEISYIDGSQKTVYEVTKDYGPDSKYFTVKPQYVQGVIAQGLPVVGGTTSMYAWVPITTYQLCWADGSYICDMSATVIPIQRGLDAGNTSFTTFPISGLYSPGSNSINSGFTPIGDGTKNYSIEATTPLFSMGYILPTLEAYTTNSTLNFVGDTDAEYYIDEDPLEALKRSGKYSLQATYADRADKEIPLANTDIRFVPFYYENDRNATAPGQVRVSIKGPTKSSDPGVSAALTALYNTSVNGKGFGDTVQFADINGKPQGSLTGVRYIPTVYHVADVAIVDSAGESIPADKVNMFYWENDDEAWLQRLIGANAELKVTYSPDADGNRATKNVAIADAIKRSSVVWVNPNPLNTNPGSAADTADNGVDQYSPWEIFGISGVSQTAKRKNAEDPKNNKQTLFTKLTDPRIIVNYRGVEAEQPVDIGISARSLDVSFKEGVVNEEGTFPIDMTWGRRATDNDAGPWNLLKDEKWFAKKLNVEVKFNTIRNGQDGEPMVLTLDTPLKVNSLADAKLGAPGTQPDPKVLDKDKKLTDANLAYRFTSDYGPIGSFTQKTGYGYGPTQAEGWDFNSWVWGISGNPKNNGAVKPVTLYYAPPEPPAYVGAVKTKALKSEPQSVLWSGIGKINPNKISDLGEE